MPYVDARSHIIPLASTTAPGLSLTPSIAPACSTREDMRDVATTSHVERATSRDVDVDEVRRPTQLLRPPSRRGPRGPLHPGGELAHEARSRSHDRELRADRPGPGTRLAAAQCPFGGLDDGFDAAVERLTASATACCSRTRSAIRGRSSRLAAAHRGRRAAAGQRLQPARRPRLGRAADRRAPGADAAARMPRPPTPTPAPASRSSRSAPTRCARLGVSDVQAFRLTQSNPRFLLREGNPRLALRKQRIARPSTADGVNSVPVVDRGLQEIVDSLTLSLGRPVLIDDAELRPLAYSTQFGELDAVRTASILGRLAPDEARVALFAEGIRTATAPVHIPARPEIGMRARVCVPLVGGGRRLGYLWLFEDPAVSADELRLARAAAAEAAALVGPDADAQLIRRRHEQQLVTALLSIDAAEARPPRRPRGRALPAAAAAARVGRRPGGPGGGGVERGGAGPAAGAARGQAGAVRGARAAARVPGGGARGRRRCRRRWAL